MTRNVVWRMLWLFTTAGLLFALHRLAPATVTTAPNPLHIAFYKITLVMLAACVAYVIDCVLFPYARPDSFLQDGHADWEPDNVGSDIQVDYPVIEGAEMLFAVAQLRRALIVGMCVLGVSLGM